MLRLMLAAAAMAAAPMLARAGPLLLLGAAAPATDTPALDGGSFQAVYDDQAPDPGEGWGMRRLADAPAAPRSQARLDSTSGPSRAAEVQAGYLWEDRVYKAVIGYTQLDMGPRADTRALGAPDLLRPPREDAPGVLGLGVVIRTR